ncbi:hypothetical protein GTA08_BOTSDO12025 [Neofusicoccum parvum]|uniref:Uncharacterized protein n=2 Tax=Neofusicoccum TaxID=407951 RepID=A0ABR3SIM3_9PEZI|nr:hypothetical protein GTA08_BOTSDO12025 [Neofusicoccum parvum]GME56344.1 hypothetical protein GTA08_BOTSDO12025 [Neofusicoccum parvum]
MPAEVVKAAQHPMFDVIYEVRDRIDRVKALEAEKQRDAAAFDDAQQNLKDIKSRGDAPSSDDIERVHQAMSSRTNTRLEIMTIMQDIGDKSELIFQLRDDYEAYCKALRKAMKPGEKPPPMASDVLKEIAEVMDLLKTDV